MTALRSTYRPTYYQPTYYHSSNLNYQRYRPAYGTQAIWYPFRSLYHHVWDRFRNHSGSGGLGVGLNEAKQCHRRAYGGLVSYLSAFDLYIAKL
jgi:hypothetical protein